MEDNMVKNRGDLDFCLKKKGKNRRDKRSDRRGQDELDRTAADRAPEPGAIDRPGFDLGGSTGETTAGAGLGLGEDAAENRLDRSLPGRRARSKLSIPRWSGPTPAKKPK
jgi:hypothetical protein